MNSTHANKGPKNPLLRDTIAACGKAFAVIAVFSMFINLLMLTAPLYMLQVFDRVITSRNTDTLVMLMLIAGFALLTMAALEAVRTLALIRVSSWIDAQLAGRVLSESVASTLNSRGGASIQGLRDLTTVRTFLSGQSVFPIMDAPWTPIFLAVMFMLHPFLGWLSVFGAIVLFSLALANELATRNLLMHSGGASIAALRMAESAARNADVIEAMGMMPGLVRRWGAKNADSLILQAQASTRSGGITAVTKLIRMCLQIGIMSLGAWLVIAGEITPGVMIAASILMGRALAPVEQAIGTWKQLLAARSAYNRVKDQLDATPASTPAMPLPPPTGNVRAEGVVFAHSGASEPLLRNITFQLQPGEVLGLIGPTAVGKTTLARLLVGNLAPRAGHIRLDGMDVAQWESTDLGRHIGYLPQDVELFAGTVNENIARMQEADPEMVVTAARMAGVHEMILSMEKGYDTEIGDGGAALSGGQRQRLALARAVYGEPKFLVLDEPNANLDGDGEAALIRTIDALKERRATITVIAHRPSVLQNVDKILVLRSGTIEMFGPRNEVIASLADAESPHTVAGKTVGEMGKTELGQAPASPAPLHIPAKSPPPTSPAPAPEPEVDDILDGISSWARPQNFTPMASSKPKPSQPKVPKTEEPMPEKVRKVGNKKPPLKKGSKKKTAVQGDAKPKKRAAKRAKPRKAAKPRGKPSR